MSPHPDNLKIIQEFLEKQDERVRTEEDAENQWWAAWDAAIAEVREKAQRSALERREAAVARTDCVEKTAGRFAHVCRKCAWCLKQRSRQWVARAKHEFYSHERAVWITLTYRGSDEQFYEELQKWFKTLRKAGHVFRYVVSEEFGAMGQRRHWHVMLFCRSTTTVRTLRKSWKHGFERMRLARSVALVAYMAKYLGKVGRIRASVGFGNGLRAIQRARPDLCVEYDRWLFAGGLRPQWVRCWGCVSQHSITIDWATAPPF